MRYRSRSFLAVCANMSGVCFALAMFAATAATLLGADAIPAPTPQPSATPTVKLPPEEQKKLTESLEKLSRGYRKYLDGKLREYQDDLAKTAALSPAQIDTLERAATEARENTTREFVSKVAKIWTDYYDRIPGQFLAAFTNFPDENADFSNGTPMYSDFTQPLDQEVWKSAIEQTLTPEQKAAWQKILATRLPPLDENATTFVANQVTHMTEQAGAVMALKAARISQNLALPKERADQLESLAKAAAEQSAQAAGQRIAKRLSAMELRERDAMVKSKIISFMIREEDGPDRQSAWVDGVPKMLSDDERAKLASIAELRRQQLARVQSRLMLSLLDEKVAFTAAQRTRLLPLMERAVQASPALLAEQSTNNPYYAINVRTFFQAAQNIPPDDLKGLLDAVQWKRWRAACDPAVETNFDTSDDDDDDEETIVIGRPAPPPTPAPTPSLEPEEVERAISDFIAEKAARQRHRTVGVLTLEADDFARVASLPPEKATVLHLAALGSVEEAMEAYKMNIENVVRSQINDARPDNIRQKLAGIQSYYFSTSNMGNNQGQVKNVFMTHFVDAETTAAQRAAWQKEKDLRSDFRFEAIAGVITASVDRDVSLKLEQWDKIHAKLLAVLGEYKVELDTFFNSSNNTPWYLQSYSMAIPMAGISEQELRAILEPSQWDRWTASPNFSNATTYWQNITSNHERTKKAADN